MVDEIDLFITSMQKQEIFNGSLAIIDKGKVIYNSAVGYTDYDKQTILDTNTIFNIGSISKDFTAMSVLLLLEEDKMALTDPMSKYFSDLPAWASEININNLLSHSSGLPNYGYQVGLNNSQIIPHLQRISHLEFPPGTDTLYGSYGYQILSIIVEKISKKPFGEFVKNRIFVPLAMKYSYVIGTEPLMSAQLAMGYEFGEQNIPQDFTTGAGNIYTNVSDLLKWERALNNNSLVNESTLQKALVPFKCWGGDCRLNTDFGIGVYEKGKLQGIHHHGGFGGYQSMLYRFPSKNRAIIFTANNGLELQYNDIRFTLMSILDGVTPTYPKKDAHIIYYQALIKDGIKVAKSAYLACRKDNEKFDINEKDMNSIGYYILGQNKSKQALQTFKFNTELFPDSANSWDSYGEALEKTEKLGLARVVYERALKLADASHNEKLAKSLETSLARVDE